MIAKSQNCYDSANVYRFYIDEKKYELVQELKSWEAAAECAIEHGGYLVHINSQAEQDSVYHHVAHLSGIDTAYINVYDAGNVAYVWIGGTDKFQEDYWIWDGNDDNCGYMYWYGAGFLGDPIEGMYQNWGTKADGSIWEPDDYNNQDGAAMGLEKWPAQNPNVQYGTPGQWNDIDAGNEIFYVIEYELNENIVPQLDNSLQDIDTISNTFFEIHIPENTFFDANGQETLTYTAELTNGEPLPEWLSFDQENCIIAGTAPSGDTLTIKIVATDTEGAHVWDTFELRIENNPSANITYVDADTDVLIYPNPASDRLYFKSINGLNCAFVEIFDFHGRLVLSGEVLSKVLDVSRLPVGIYLVRVVLPTQTICIKTMIE